MDLLRPLTFLPRKTRQRRSAGDAQCRGAARADGARPSCTAPLPLQMYDKPGAAAVFGKDCFKRVVSRHVTDCQFNTKQTKTCEENSISVEIELTIVISGKYLG